MKLVSLLTAVAVSTVFALFGFPFRYYACWWSFSRVTSTGLIVLYFLTAGAGGGLFGWAFGRLGDVHLTSSLAADGVFYGLTGAVALRADFGARKKRAQTRDIDPTLQDVRSILGVAITWIEKALDDVAETRAGNWLSAMSNERLAEQANSIQSKIKMRLDVPSRAKAKMRETLVSSIEKLGTSNSSEARGDIVAFCADYYSTSHLPRIATAPRFAARKPRALT